MLWANVECRVCQLPPFPRQGGGPWVRVPRLSWRRRLSSRPPGAVLGEPQDRTVPKNSFTCAGTCDNNLGRVVWGRGEVGNCGGDMVRGRWGWSGCGGWPLPYSSLVMPQVKGTHSLALGALFHLHHDPTMLPYISLRQVVCRHKVLIFFEDWSKLLLVGWQTQVWVLSEHCLGLKSLSGYYLKETYQENILSDIFKK